MKNVLLLMGRYLPGHKDGGPLRTMINVTEALGEEYNFYIACYDRDHGDTVPYPDIEYGKWKTVGKAKVMYVKPGGFTFECILKLSLKMDIIYLTNFYESYGYKTLFLRRKGKIKCPVALASMGVFSKEALAQKAIKKKLFIAVCKVLGLFNNITWSVTSELEAEDIKRVIGNKTKYIVAEDLPRTNIPGIKRNYDGKIRIVFLSRICEHKNPLLLIEAVSKMENTDNIEVHFYGPIQEEDYWNKCLERLKNVKYKWSYVGDVPSDKVQEVLSNYDVLVLPSKSENYGHVIFEALSVGCIPVISDRTPWNDLEIKNAGLICKLSENDFLIALNKICDMDPDIVSEMKKNAVNYAKEKVDKSKQGTGYRVIFG